MNEGQDRPALDEQRGGRSPRWLRSLGGLALAICAWLWGDLVFAWDLPGASRLLWWAFQAAMLPKLLVDAGHPAVVAAPLILGVAALLGLRDARLERLVDVLLAAGVVLPLGVVLAIGGLMERATFSGLLVAFFVLGRSGSVLPRFWASLRPRLRMVLWSASVAALIVALRYLHLLLMTEPGYPLLTALGRWTRAGHLPLNVLFFATVLLGAALLLGRGLSHRGGPAALAMAVGPALSLGVAAILGMRLFLGDDAPVGLALAVLALGTLAADVLGPWLLARPSGPYPLSQFALRAALLPVVLGGVLIGQAYAGRMLLCPPLDPAGPLERIANVPEAFRVELGRDGGLALLSLRQTAELARIRLQPAVGEAERVPPGPAASHPGGTGGPASELLGPPEEILYDPVRDRFLAVLVTPQDFDGSGRGLSAAGACEEAGDFGSVVVEVDAEGAAVQRAFVLDGLCWVSRLGWDPVGQQALLGWEYRPGLNTLREGPDSTEQWPVPEAVGDISGIAVDPRPERDRFYVVSLWESDALTRLRRSDRSVDGAVRLGGFNYDVVLDADRELLYVPAYYASRIHVVDAQTLRKTGSLPTGLGARAVALAPSDGVLLGSSVYDGQLRAWDLETHEQVAALHVGGHVKDIAVDPRRSQAVFWSQCGLMRLDLGTWLGRGR